jgi:hypothetical protein
MVERKIAAYSDATHAEDMRGIEVGEFNYKYRLLAGRMMPPYVTPARYEVARSTVTRPRDICYTSYPKSGSTWLAHILLLIVNGGENPPEGTLRSHLHWVESSWTYPRTRDELAALPSPRIFKSHMPYDMALGGDPAANPCRYVYIARNPKDVACSYYFFERGKAWSGRYDGPWEHWLDSFLDGRVQRGDWFDHVLGWWTVAQRADNILFLRYEDLLTDFQTQLRALAEFLGYRLSEGVLGKIQAETSFARMSGERFSNMSEIEDFETFFRKGEIGSWRAQFTAEQNERFDRVIARRLSGSGPSFRYEFASHRADMPGSPLRVGGTGKEQRGAGS